MTMLEYHEARANVRADDKDQRRRLSGYAAVYNSLSNDLGGYREIIRPGAFDECLAEAPDISARVQHAGGLATIGRTSNGTLKVSADARGLWYVCTLPDTQAAADIFALVEKGFIDKSSFAFTLRGEEGDRWNWQTDPPLRELLNVDLHDVAPVDGPAYPASSVVAVRQQVLAQARTGKNTRPASEVLALKRQLEADISRCSAATREALKASIRGMLEGAVIRIERY